MINMVTLCYDYEMFIAGYISSLNKNDSWLMYIFHFLFIMIELFMIDSYEMDSYNHCFSSSFL